MFGVVFVRLSQHGWSNSGFISDFFAANQQMMRKKAGRSGNVLTVSNATDFSQSPHWVKHVRLSPGCVQENKIKQVLINNLIAALLGFRGTACAMTEAGSAILLGML